MHSQKAGQEELIVKDYGTTCDYVDHSNLSQPHHCHQQPRSSLIQSLQPSSQDKHYEPPHADEDDFWLLHLAQPIVLTESRALRARSPNPGVGVFRSPCAGRPRGILVLGSQTHQTYQRPIKNHTGDPMYTVTRYCYPHKSTYVKIPGPKYCLCRCERKFGPVVVEA